MTSISIRRPLMALALAALPLLAAAPAQAHDQVGLVANGNNILFVFANVVEGQEAEFNTWYDKHMQQIMKLPGFVRCQRLLMQSRAGKTDPAFRYVVLYEFKGDPDAVMAALGPAVKEGRLMAPDPRYVLKTESMVYKAIQPGFPATNK